MDEGDSTCGVDNMAPRGSGVSEVNSLTDMAEVATPPLVLLSSRVRSPGALASCVNPGVVVVK